MLAPAVLLRMAVLVIKWLPGIASMRLWAFFLGSSAGTLLVYRTAAAEMAGAARRARAGRRRGAPARGSASRQLTTNWLAVECHTYRRRFEPSGTPL